MGEISSSFIFEQPATPSSLNIELLTARTPLDDQATQPDPRLLLQSRDFEALFEKDSRRCFRTIH